MMSSCYICFAFMMMVMVVLFNLEIQPAGPSGKTYSHNGSTNNRSTTTEQQLKYHLDRKLLVHGACTHRDISILQSRDTESGIPQYIVQIVSTCEAGCAPSEVHVHCGWFASARIVNPRTFKRLSYDDCLVNGGKPLKTCQIIRFTYSNSFMYPLKFKSAKFC